MNLRIISAGAGSGKTYRLTSEMVAFLKEKKARPSGIIATTFTKKAAAELQERVRQRLLEEGLGREADELTNALIGTVHGLGVKLLRRFAFEAGVSPSVDIIADEDQQLLFNQSLSTVLTQERVEKMDLLSDRLGMNKREHYDWRKDVRQLTDVARANDFDFDVLEKSKKQSVKSFLSFLDEPASTSPEMFHQQLIQQLETTLQQLEKGEDATKKTQGNISYLKGVLQEARLREEFYWHQWVKISKLDVGAKSRETVKPLKAMAAGHLGHPQFHQDIKDFIYAIFDITQAAIQEYDTYKKRRGLIDYTDMEVLIKRLLEQEAVREVLKEELDLLMVDEFQDTSPIQLELFLKLSKLAKYSIWVGDPKQSIYGFRGAEPKLMQAIIEQTGGIKPEDIQTFSWRSREDVVFATNAIFTKAFPQLKEEQIALMPKRRIKASANSLSQTDEPGEMKEAVQHWHFEFEGKGRPPGKPWMENCMANSVKRILERGIHILPKGEKSYRLARPGDVAILCRSNSECQTVAEALHRAGLKAAISRVGLLNTAESKLILACLKYILNKQDSLSVAEILLLTGNLELEEIIESRVAYLDITKDLSYDPGNWEANGPYIQKLNILRDEVVELSGAEILDLILEELDLRRVVISWGKVNQRLANVDMMRKLALQYEEACNRLHSAASLGGFLLWLNELEKSEGDLQGSGESLDAVNVLTYHKSKGLEWPIVLCHSLEGSLKEQVWGIQLIPESETVDLDNVLGNRWLRYWINPYSDQFRNTILEERIEVSPAKAVVRAQALQEEARLLYVGITRARDYIVFPTRKKDTKWLNRVWHQGQEDYPTLEIGQDEGPWEWKNYVLPIYEETFIYPRDFTHADVEEPAIEYLEEAAGQQGHKAYVLDLRRTQLDESVVVGVSSTKSFWGMPELPEDMDFYQLAKAIKAFLTADRTSYAKDLRLNMATQLLDRFDIEDGFDGAHLVELATNWQNHLAQQFQIRSIRRKYPIRYYHGSQEFQTIIDVLLETDQGMVIIQNSGFVGDQSKWKHKIQELGSWLFLSKRAIQHLFGAAPIKTMVHFVLYTTILEVETSLEE